MVDDDQTRKPLARTQDPPPKAAAPPRRSERSRTRIDKLTGERSGPIYLPGEFCGEERYAIIRTIASGGMAEIYEAYDRVAECPRAIKTLQWRFQWNEKTESQLMAEGKALMRVKHPNLVKVHATGIDPEKSVLYVVMDLLDGVTLDAKIHHDGALALDEALDVLANIGDAMDAIHALKIIHRDLKPDNVFLTRNEETGEIVPIVIDLGIAKFSSDRFTVIKTEEGKTMGTGAYMSPEQILTPNEVDGRADIWALGHIFWKMLTGQHIFWDHHRRPDPPKFAEYTANQLYAELPPPSRLVRWLPVEVSRFCARMLERDREKRFQTMVEVAAEARWLIATLGKENRLRPPGAPAPTPERPRSDPRVLPPGARPSDAISRRLPHATTQPSELVPSKPPPMLAPVEPARVGSTAGRTSTGTEIMDVPRSARSSAPAQPRASTGDEVLAEPASPPVSSPVEPQHVPDSARRPSPDDDAPRAEPWFMVFAPAWTDRFFTSSWWYTPRGSGARAGIMYLAWFSALLLAYVVVVSPLIDRARDARPAPSAIPPAPPVFVASTTVPGSTAPPAATPATADAPPPVTPAANVSQSASVQVKPPNSAAPATPSPASASADPVPTAPASARPGTRLPRNTGVQHSKPKAPPADDLFDEP